MGIESENGSNIATFCPVLLKWSLALESKAPDSELWKIGDKSHFDKKSDTLI